MLGRGARETFARVPYITQVSATQLAKPGPEEMKFLDFPFLLSKDLKIAKTTSESPGRSFGGRSVLHKMRGGSSQINSVK